MRESGVSPKEAPIFARAEGGLGACSSDLELEGDPFERHGHLLPQALRNRHLHRLAFRPGPGLNNRVAPSDLAEVSGQEAASPTTIHLEAMKPAVTDAKRRPGFPKEI